MGQPGRQPMAGIVLLRAELRGRAEAVADALGRALVVGGEGDPDVAVVQDGIVLAVSFADLVEALGDQIGADAIARHERKRALEEVKPPQRRKLVQHHEELAAASCGRGAAIGFV